MTDIRVVLITCKDDDQASGIARELVQQRLAACVSLIPQIRSLYVWQGKLEETSEVMLVAKTRQELVGRLEEAVRALHSYECPEIISMPVDQGFAPYLAWVRESTS
ncbi:MAG: divalent-cation tolerance protein CutA [Candidatus Omnitrophica bacterium]|jgi:periplasmic divalent cation tolerance protein|nr:divalent-cation tolerance protein CutA [Candidatus Omnitrophota bacterium]